MREPTVAAGVVHALLELATSKGAGRTILLARAKIDDADLEDPDRRVPFRKYVALMRAGQQLARDPALALHFGELDASELSIAHALGGATSLDEAIAQGNRYAALGVEVDGDGTGDRFQLRRIEARLWLVDARSNPNAFPELTESTFARMACSTRRVLGNAQFITALRVTHAEPAYRAEYDRIFRVPVTFGCAQNAIQINEALLSRCQFPRSPRYVTRVLRNHADALLLELERSRSTRDRVERLLLARLSSGTIRIEPVAASLGLSRQTLFRRLRAEGVTFEGVVDRVRRQLALDYLAVKHATVKETARRLGYSDPSAFSRAFKRWTGGSPRGYARKTTPSEQA